MNGAVAKWLTRRSAKPLYEGSIPSGASKIKLFDFLNAISWAAETAAH